MTSHRDLGSPRENSWPNLFALTGQIPALGACDQIEIEGPVHVSPHARLFLGLLPHKTEKVLVKCYYFSGSDVPDIAEARDQYDALVYRKMRQKYDVLMTEKEPEGGAWNFDAENRKAFGKAGPQNVPTAPQVSVDELTQAVIDDIEQHFPHHPGSLTNFIWPVTREAALQFLEDFIANKLAGFGDHQDAMWQNAQSNLDSDLSPYLWHSLLSTSLNLKLLNPREVIAAAVTAYKKNQLPLASVEGFIRQILGWREFIRGMYWLDMPQMAQANHYQHSRALPSWYWSGDSHMNCMKQTVNDTMQHGYAHHIQRLMVTGMFGILAEISPREVEAWYLAVYVDAVEWVELPNVAGMALYANGGRFTSKPYVASGAYIKRMSNYCSGCQYKPELTTRRRCMPYYDAYIGIF